MSFSTLVKRTRTMFGSACRQLSVSPALLLSPEREHSQPAARGLFFGAGVPVSALVRGLLLRLVRSTRKAPQPLSVTARSPRTAPGHVSARARSQDSVASQRPVFQSAHGTAALTGVGTITSLVSAHASELPVSAVADHSRPLVSRPRTARWRSLVTALSRLTGRVHGSARPHSQALELSASLVSGHEAAPLHSQVQARSRRQQLTPRLALRFLSATVRSHRTAPGSGSDSSPARVRALSPRLVSVRALAQRLSQVLARAPQPEPLSASARSQEPGQGRSPRLARFRFALRTVAASLPRQARPRHPRRRAGMPARLSRRAAVSHRRVVLRSSGRRRLETFARRLHSRHLLLHGRSRSSSDDRSMRSRSVARGFAVFRSSVRPCSRTQSCSHAGSHLTPRSSTVSLTAMQPARSSAQPKRTSARRRQSSTFASRSASFLRDFGKHQEPSPRPRSLRLWFRPTRSSPPRSSTRTERLGQPCGFTQTFSPRTHRHAQDSRPAVFRTDHRLCAFRSSPPIFQRNLMLMASSPVSLRTHSF
jgi:hypothetical protein